MQNCNSRKLLERNEKCDKANVVKLRESPDVIKEVSESHWKINKYKNASTDGNKMCRVMNYADDSMLADTLHSKSQVSSCFGTRCSASLMKPHVVNLQEEDYLKPGILRLPYNVLKHARNFLEQFYEKKVDSSEEMAQRLRVIIEEVKETGTYELTKEELIFGVHLAWRNAARCIGRIQWKKLEVFDARHITTAKEMFHCILHHLKYATNGGKIRSAITIFPQKRENFDEFRIWNSQLIKYAGYQQPDGTIIGDKMSVELTNIAIGMGWKGEGTPFDVLPLILQARGSKPEIFEIPSDLVLEVDITHPTYPQISELGLKWYCVPAVADMMLDVGGIQFTASPFNGWYMATEISARNFLDTYRYNLLKPIAKKLAYNTNTNTNLWKDLVAIELTVAVMHSFIDDGVTIMDHHTSAESFMKHLKDENKLRGGCPSEWIWIVPPISGSITPVFHQEMLNYKLYPSFEYQENAWKYNVVLQRKNRPKKSFKAAIKCVFLCSVLFVGALKKRQKATILYATETGRSKEYAEELNNLFRCAFNSKVVCMEDYNIKQLKNEQFIALVASTFGNGEPPDNGDKFWKELCLIQREESHEAFSDLRKMKVKSVFPNLKFSVFSLGSRAYPKFCEFGNSLSLMFGLLGCDQIYQTGQGDELCAQEETFKEWANGCFKAACQYFLPKSIQLPPSLMNSEVTELFRIREADKTNQKIMKLKKALSTFYRKDVFVCDVHSVKNLQSTLSNRTTNLVRLGLNGEHGSNYLPGDHLYIFPENNPEIVRKLLERVDCHGMHPEELVNIQSYDDKRGWKNLNRLPMPIALKNLFLHYLDISTPPSPKLLAYFATCSTNVEETTYLMMLANNTELYLDWKQKKELSALEVLQEFPFVKVDVTYLINHLPALKPRPYSISSSPKLYPKEVHITTALIKYKTENGDIRRGLCSSFLDTRKHGDKIYCFVKRTPSFKLPDDISAPIMMVGPGTGIAPFRSFWQHRSAEMTEDSHKKGEILMYFGCRHPEKDNIYCEELKEVLENGVISKLHIAYSRLQNRPKIYVQDLLITHGKEVSNFLLNPDSHFYVCGDITMASDVKEALLKVLVDHQTFSEVDAADILNAMKTQGRYHEDIFGVTLKLKMKKEDEKAMKQS